MTVCAPAHVHVHPCGLTQWAIHNCSYNSHFSYLTQWAIHNFSYISYFSYLVQWAIHDFFYIYYFSFLTQWAIPNLTQWGIHNFSYRSNAFLCKPSVLLKAPDFKQWRLRWQELSVQVCTCLKNYFHILTLNLRSFSFAPSASERPQDVADDTTLFKGGLSIRDQTPTGFYVRSVSRGRIICEGRQIINLEIKKNSCTVSKVWFMAQKSVCTIIFQYDAIFGREISVYASYFQRRLTEVQNRQVFICSLTYTPQNWQAPNFT